MLWITQVIPLYLGLLKPGAACVHGQVTVSLYMGKVTFLPNSFFFFSNFLIVLTAHAHHMRKKTKITDIDKNGSPFSDFTLSLPQRQLWFPACGISCKDSPHTPKHVH